MAELGTLFPDWRLGQTLANLAMAAGRPDSGAVWDLEDSEALAVAKRLIERSSLRQTKETNNSLPRSTEQRAELNRRDVELEVKPAIALTWERIRASVEVKS